MSEHPKTDHMSQHMSDFTAGKNAEHMPTRTSEHSSEYFPALFVQIDYVPEHKPDLMPEHASEHCVNPHVHLCEASLSMHVPCLSKSPLSVGIN